MRDLLCLDTAAVCSYQLGSHELKCAGHEQTPTISGGGGNGSQGGVSVDEDRVRRLEEQMVKARSSSRWSPYDGVGAVNADPKDFSRRISPPRVPRFQSRHTSTPFNSN